MLYSWLAYYYDKIYSHKDYATEAGTIRSRLHQLGIPDGSRILDAGCGTGNHLSQLDPYFSVAGFDLYPEMLTIAKEKLPHIPLFQADMRKFKVDVKYDAILVLFRTIGYLLCQEHLEEAAHAFANALRPGGVLLIEPWLSIEDWDVGRPTIQTYTSENIGLARAVVAQRRDDIAVMDMHWLIAKRETLTVEHIVERHDMWLCSENILQKSFEKAGFHVSSDADGLTKDSTLVIGIKNQ